MRFRKAGRSCNTYTYEFSFKINGREDEEPDVVTITLESDRNKDFSIVDLYRADDREVYNNEKNARSDFNDKGKKERQEWKESFREQFREQHGYYPNDDDTEYFCKEAFSNRWTLSLDKAADDFGDKTPLVEETASRNTEEPDELSDYLADYRETLPEVKRAVYDLVLLYEEKKKDVAEELGLSDVRISQIAKELEEKLRNDEKIRKIFSRASVSD